MSMGGTFSDNCPRPFLIPHQLKGNCKIGFRKSTLQIEVNKWIREQHSRSKIILFVIADTSYCDFELLRQGPESANSRSKIILFVIADTSYCNFELLRQGSESSNFRSL